MVFGLSFLPNDIEFYLTEAASNKKQHIYVPGDWKEIFMNAKRKCPKLDAI